MTASCLRRTRVTESVSYTLMIVTNVFLVCNYLLPFLVDSVVFRTDPGTVNEMGNDVIAGASELL